MTVRQYYTKHFDELSEANQFLFASTLKNWYQASNPPGDDGDLPEPTLPSRELAELFQSQDFHQVKQLELKKPYLEHYPGILGIEAALRQVHFLLQESGTDLRPDFLELLPQADLYSLSDQLLASDAALATLSELAVNVICLTEELFPRGHNPAAELAAKALHLSSSPEAVLALSTAVIFADSAFFTRPIPQQNLPLYRPLLAHCKSLIESNLTTLPLELKLAFLVCCKLVNATALPSANATKNLPATWAQAPTGYLPLVGKISRECQTALAAQPFLTDPRLPAQSNTLDASTPRSLYFILSGLDLA